MFWEEDQSLKKDNVNRNLYSVKDRKKKDIKMPHIKIRTSSDKILSTLSFLYTETGYNDKIHYNSNLTRTKHSLKK